MRLDFQGRFEDDISIQCFLDAPLIFAFPNDWPGWSKNHI